MSRLNHETLVFRTVPQHLMVIEANRRNFKLIPEFTNALDRDRDVPWRAMAGMRDQLIHAYDNINVDIVWNTARTTVLEVLPRIQNLLSDTRNS